MLIDANVVVPLPDDLSFADATARMVQGLTALFLTRQVSPRGRNVLVSAAAGGVGSLLMQLAKRAGAASVIAAASTARKLEFARALGADAGQSITRSRTGSSMPGRPPAAGDPTSSTSSVEASSPRPASRRSRRSEIS